MVVLFDGYVTKDTVNDIATILHCKTSCFNESVMFHKINEGIFDLDFDECWGSSMTLGSNIAEYYNVPMGTGLTIKHKIYKTSNIIKYIENGVNVDITFKSIDGLTTTNVRKDKNHVFPNIMDCLNVDWVIVKYNDVVI